MSEQVGWRGFIKTLKAEAPNYAHWIPQLPRLLHEQFTSHSPEKIEAAFRLLLAQQERRNHIMLAGIGLLVVIALGVALLVFKTLF
jgi:ubiquinone biosynthesis protein